MLRDANQASCLPRTPRHSRTGLLGDVGRLRPDGCVEPSKTLRRDRIPPQRLDVYTTSHRRMAVEARVSAARSAMRVPALNHESSTARPTLVAQRTGSEGN